MAGGRTSATTSWATAGGSAGAATFRRRGAELRSVGHGLGLDLLTDPDQLSHPVASPPAPPASSGSVNDLGPLARAGDITGVTRKINGGLIGLADRQAAFMRARTILGEAA
jgi:putative chitinase